MNNNIRGFLLVFFGAICFSSKAIMIKLAYQYPVDALSLLTLRMTFALPFFVAVAFFNSTRNKAQEPVSSKDYWIIIVLGLLGYYTASILDFMGLKHISAGLERLILFIYPTIVVLISFIFFKKPINKIVYLALALTYAGVAVVFLDNFTLGQKNVFLGTALIFGSAITYAVYLVGTERLVPRIGSIRFTAYAMIVSSLAVIIHFLLIHSVSILDLPKEVYIYGFAIAIIATVIPTFMITEGIKMVGAGKAAIIASIGPITTITMEHFVLHEPITVYEISGTVLVMAGVLMVSLRK